MIKRRELIKKDIVKNLNGSINIRGLKYIKSYEIVLFDEGFYKGKDIIEASGVDEFKLHHLDLLVKNQLYYCVKLNNTKWYKTTPLGALKEYKIKEQVKERNQ